MIFSVSYRGKFIAYFNSRYEADRFVMNCRLCMSYDGVEPAAFEIKEEFV